MLETWKMNTHPKRYAFVKIVSSKWKRLKHHTYHLRVWKTHGQVRSSFPFEDEAIFPLLMLTFTVCTFEWTLRRPVMVTKSHTQRFFFFKKKKNSHTNNQRVFAGFCNSMQHENNVACVCFLPLLFLFRGLRF